MKVLLHPVADLAVYHRSDVANLDFLNDHSCWCFDFHPDPHTSGTKYAMNL